MMFMEKFCLLLPAVMLAMGVSAQKPAAVYITAGQSNADGREKVEKLPAYLKGGYKHLRYTNVTSAGGGRFGEFKFGKRFAFCDVTNHFIDLAAQGDFYAVKCTYGGTAIDTAATHKKLPVWCADGEWLERNKAYRGDISTGKSLTKSLTEGFAECVDTTLAGRARVST